jgi:chromosome partitioning protein
MKTIAFFNNKGGVGKTTLVYHLAWMYQELGLSVAAMDLDPQANLTAAFLPEERLEQIWLESGASPTILGVIQPLLDRLGDLKEPQLQILGDNLALLPGDLGLSLFEDRLAEAWPRCLQDNPAEAHDAFRVMSSFYRAAGRIAQAREAQLVLVDVGPSLGALNRAALVACDFVVMPLGADLYSLQGLRNLGPALDGWRKGWKKRLGEQVPPGTPLPSGDMKPIGYVVLQHAVRKDRPVKAYQRWVQRIPDVYHNKILGEPENSLVLRPDPHELAALKHYRSLMPLAQDARKPMFLLKPADGAIGSHAQAVQDCYQDFKALALRIASTCGLSFPLPDHPLSVAYT